MQFHLPKPLHGWRALFGEVGIIVIGVLIALGAEQVVEGVHERNVAEETRRAVTQEIDTNLAALYLRGTAEPCIGRRLSELRALFADWQSTGTFKTPQWVAQAPSLDIDLTRYDAALSAGRLALLPSEDQYHMGEAANALRWLSEVQDRESPLWGRLRALQAGPRALSAGDEAQLRMALQDAATLDFQVQLQENQILPDAARHGFRPDLTEFRKVVALVWKSGRFTPSICADIDMPPDEANRQTGQVVPLSL
jgi:hypothetical protein